MASSRALKLRSPNYPALGLAKAVEALKSLYLRVQRGEFTPTDAAMAWGYRGLNGLVRARFAALRQYGLIERERGGNARLSARGLTLVIRATGSGEHRSALQQAALAPPLFKALYEAGWHQDADDALRQHLVVEKRFTDPGAAQAAEVLRETLESSGLSDLTWQNEGEIMANGRELPPSSPDPALRSVQIPLPGTRWATLEGPFPVSGAVWQQMIAMLIAMKPGLVVEGGKRPAGEKD